MVIPYGEAELVTEKVLQRTVDELVLRNAMGGIQSILKFRVFNNEE
jgi:hypothetical protein